MKEVRVHLAIANKQVMQFRIEIEIKKLHDILIASYNIYRYCNRMY